MYGEAGIMITARRGSHKWVMELSFHREIQMSTSLGQPARSEFCHESEMALAKSQSVRAPVSLDRAVVVINGMTHILSIDFYETVTLVLDHPMSYHSPALISFLIFLFIKSRFNALR